MKHLPALCLAATIALTPAAAFAAPDGIYVSVFNGGLEYLSLASTGGKDVTGFIQTFSYAPNAPGGLVRSRRDVAGTAQNGHIALHSLPAWVGGEPLTGQLGWNTVTLQFTKADGSIGQETFKKMSVTDANAMIERATAQAADAVRLNDVNADLQNSSAALRNAQAELPRARQAIVTLTQQLANANKSASRAQEAEAAVSGREANERATEQQMRDQENAMPDTTPNEHQARLDYHQLVNDQHQKVNDAHGLVNDAHGSVNDTAWKVRMLQHNLEDEQRSLVQLQQIIAAATSRIRSDNQILADVQRRYASRR